MRRISLAALAVFAAFALPAGATADAAEAPRDQYLYLTDLYDVDGFGDAESGGPAEFGEGFAYVAGSLATDGGRRDLRSDRFGSVRMLLPKLTGSERNFVKCGGQRIDVRTTNVFNVLFVLGAAHQGPRIAWIEFGFEDGTTARAPLALSDWYDRPIVGDEVAFEIPSERSGSGAPVDGKLRIFLGHTPIPSAKRVTSITLPREPNALIMALTLGHRPGIEPAPALSRAPVEPALVAILDEPGLPHVESCADLAPEDLEAAYARAGISTRRIGLGQLVDAEIFDAERFPVLVLAHGRAFPSEATSALRRYRQSGGSMVHSGIPFSWHFAWVPHGFWAPLRLDSFPVRESFLHTTPPDAADYLGVGTYVAAGRGAKLEGARLAIDWGLGAIPWADYEPAGGASFRGVKADALAPGETVEPILSAGGVSFASLLRHATGRFEGCVDLWLGTAPLESPAGPMAESVWIELAVRGTAAILREKGRISDEDFARIAVPLAAESCRAPVRESGEAVTPRLPVRSGELRSLRVFEPGRLSLAERLLVESAQAIVNRDGDIGLAIVRSAADRRALEALGVEETSTVKLEEIFDLVGHRRAIVWDPALPATINTATMVAALENLLIAAPGLVERYRLEVAADLRGLFADVGELGRFTRENLWPRLRRDVFAVASPDLAESPPRDYMILHRLPVLWATRVGDYAAPGARPAFEDRQLRGFLDEAPVFAIAYGSFGVRRHTGWTREEGTTLFSESAKVFVHADEPNRSLARATWFRGIAEPAAEPRRAETGKIYIAASRVPSRAASEGVPPIVYARDELALADRAAPTDVVGSPGPGDVDWSVLGRRFADAAGLRERYLGVVDAFHEEMGHRFLTLAVPFTRALTNTESKILAGRTVFVGFGTGATAWTATWRRNGTAFVRDPGPQELAAAVAAVRAGAARATPLFLYTTLSAVDSLRVDGALPPEIELVRPDELIRLREDWEKDHYWVSRDLVTPGSNWRYSDDGPLASNDWRRSDFDDAAWTSGRAPLGYGDSSLATTIEFGGDSSNKIPAYYFRRSFDVPDRAAGLPGLVEMLVDDGGVVYLDGEEVYRVNMPAGDVQGTTLATSAASGSRETEWQRGVVDATLLRSGANAIAVEVHQSSITSSDIRFDLRLRAVGWVERPGVGGEPEGNDEP